MSNITSLEKLDNDTLADVQPLNRNFETIRTSINDNDARITELNYKKAENNSVMHLTGQEVINGVKTFNNLVKFCGGIDFDSPIISLFNIDTEGFVIKFSNNFIIQCGKAFLQENNKEYIISLREEMLNKDYFCFISGSIASFSSSNDYGGLGISPNDTRSISIMAGRVTSSTYVGTRAFWLVCGMAKG